MVSLDVVRASNARLKKLQPGLVALFVGATSGIGEYTLKQFYQQTTSPRVYFVGRNHAAAARILADLHALNPTGTATFLPADITHLPTVHTLCSTLLRREKTLNLLFLTPGFLSLSGRDPTPDDLDLDRKHVANYYARLYFTHLLLPLLRAAAATGALARVVSVLGAGSEGAVDLADLALRRGYSLGACLRHSVGMTAFAFEELAARGENGGVSFVHAYPGWVKSGFGRGAGGVVELGMRVVMGVMGPWVVGPGESGERHLYVGTSAAFPPRGGAGGEGLVEGEQVASGSDGVAGSGAYLVGKVGQVVGNEKVLEELRARGAGRTIWDHTTEIFERVGKGEEVTGEADAMDG